MGVLDAVVSDVGNQLRISGGSAGSVLSGLLSFINQDAGGVSGFLDRFRRSGASSVVTSWLGGEAKPVSADTVESALGRETIDRIAANSGISFSTAASAIALMLPKLVQRLTPGGVIPSRLSADVASCISGPTAAMASGARQAVYAAETMARPGGTSRFLWPVLALLLIGGVAMWLSSRRITVGNTPFNAEEQLRLASERASAALASLKPGFSAPELVSALNLEVINFAPGSATIPSENYEFLNKAAAALKTGPSGVTIEVGGHTDNTGDASSNLRLSQERAEAVRQYFVEQGVGAGTVTARGYGDTRPVASNETEEGRFRNRRIEFSAR